MPKRSASSAGGLPPRLVAVRVGPTMMWAEIAGIPVVTSQTCRSCTSTTPGSAARVAADRLGVEAAAAPPP